MFHGAHERAHSNGSTRLGRPYGPIDIDEMTRRSAV